MIFVLLQLVKLWSHTDLLMTSKLTFNVPVATNAQIRIEILRLLSTSIPVSRIQHIMDTSRACCSEGLHSDGSVIQQ
jgi:hypothetical protein